MAFVGFPERLAELAASAPECVAISSPGGDVGTTSETGRGCLSRIAAITLA